MTAQTPAHDIPNPDLLAILPVVERLVEVGCSRGALARAYRNRHPQAHWLGIEIDSSYAQQAQRLHGPGSYLFLWIRGWERR